MVRVIAAAMFAIALAIGGVQAQERRSQTVELRPGHIQVVKFEQAFATVMVGDPGVVDVTTTTAHLLAIQAKKVGSTNVAVFDSDGQQIYNLEIAVSEARIGGSTIVHNKKAGLSEYTAYKCTPTGCRRVKDEFESPPPILVPYTVQTTTTNRDTEGNIIGTSTSETTRPRN